MSPNLSNMPVPVLDLIFKDANVHTIQVLRKVCHSIRNHIDNNSQLDAKIKSIRIRVTPQKTVFIGLETESYMYKIYYGQSRNGCEVSYLEKSKIVDNQDFASVAGADLGLILQHQKSQLEKISFDFEKPQKKRLSFECLETIGGRFSASLEPHLKTRKNLVQIQEFQIEGTDKESQIMKVLPYLSPEKLERIVIRLPTDYGCSSPNMDFDEIVKLEQWKQAKNVRIMDLSLSTALGNFNHFEKAEFEIKTISTDEIIEMRETILQKSKFIHFSFDYRHLADKKNFLESFGEYYPGSDEGNLIWYYKMKNINEVLNISWCEKGKCFSFFPVTYSDLPEDVVFAKN